MAKSGKNNKKHSFQRISTDSTQNKADSSQNSIIEDKLESTETTLRSFKLSIETYDLLRLAAFQSKRKQKDIVESALKEYLKKYLE
jgi:hypothetical protein